ncbi:MAG: neocarzinostatin apoprotein domain-containing protein [bacterium]|nr:neocarzinostatin apoprotein domain-containing protein [bacterium]
MLDWMSRAAAITCVFALSAVVLLSCGSSGDQTPEAPEDASAVEASAGPTPAAEATGSDQTSEDSVGTTAPVTPSVPPEEPEATADESAPIVSGLGYIEETFVDHDRPTPPSGNDPGKDSRTLRTLLVYPAAADGSAASPVENAQPAGGPYPLVLLAHGLSGYPEGYGEFLAAIASAGYIIAAPEFPRSSRFNPGGADAGDTESQPGDLSFLIDTVVQLDADPQWPLANMVDSSKIAAIGHSNGAITVLGIGANSCCRDERVSAVVPMAGPPAPFEGEYDFTDTPPILIIHGTKDPLILYATSPKLFNDISAIKGLLTLTGADHGSWLGSDSDLFDDVVATIMDFLAVAFDDDEQAATRLQQPRSSPNAELVFAAEAKSGLTVEFEVPELSRQASAEPTTGLVDGQTVVVSWSGFLPEQTVNILQCSQGGIEGSGVCDFTNARILHPNPTGEGSVELTIVVGAVGSGICDATVEDCVIAVNDSGLQDPEATIRIPLSFAP